MLQVLSGIKKRFLAKKVSCKVEVEILSFLGIVAYDPLMPWLEYDFCYHSIEIVSCLQFHLTNAQGENRDFDQLHDCMYVHSETSQVHYHQVQTIFQLVFI